MFCCDQLDIFVTDGTSFRDEINIVMLLNSIDDDWFWSRMKAGFGHNSLSVGRPNAIANGVSVV
jgi:hypothetical protein